MKGKVFPGSRSALTLAAAGLVALALAPAVHAENPANAPVVVANDRADDMRALLAQGWDPNTRIKGQPAIMQAVRDGAWHVYDVLAADRRTDVNASNDHDETPLMYLAIQGQTDRAKALIARGAQVNRLGWTPLHYAASKGQMDVAQLLLAHRAIVNAPGPDGTTPLMMAGLSGSRDMVDLLLKAGADPTTHNLQGLDAAAWASSARHQELATYLSQASSELQARRDAMARGAGAAGGAPATTATPGAASPAPNAPAADTASGTPATGAATVPPAPANASPGGDGQAQPTLKGVEGIRLDPNGGGAR
ncbi:ankyrin repeat domain-containing protein [Bordetella bronchialis]|uniref:Uncharacterized protein n=1 Tax=Bordetella bronchialis TaxID=463025 RepID=A0A193FYK0_9BORD|nr:ankyrin repeat domain-containing protein [Bordetella bronchialis]ANN72458.1 hypothetical protein BAU08_14860 [Bordetella bronchialis]